MSEWIDTRDAVPDSGRRVFVTVHRRDIDSYETMVGHYDYNHWIKPSRLGAVIGWQELPEPYRR